MTINNPKRIVFDCTKDLNKIIFEILGNNNLKEDREDLFKKIEQRKTPRFNILYNLAKDLAENSITESGFLSSAKKELEISEEIAKNILKETVEIILPLALTLNNEDLEEENIVEEKKPIIEPVPAIDQQKEIPAKPTVESQNRTTGKIKKPATPEQSIPKKRQYNKKDTYREPIE